MNKKGFKIDFLMDYKEEDILSEIKRVAKLLGKSTIKRRILKPMENAAMG